MYEMFFRHNFTCMSGVLRKLIRFLFLFAVKQRTNITVPFIDEKVRWQVNESAICWWEKELLVLSNSPYSLYALMWFYPIIRHAVNAKRKIFITTNSVSASIMGEVSHLFIHLVQFLILILLMFKHNKLLLLLFLLNLQ